ncbi:MAG: DNA recombination protein RmuC [Candidatus Methylomirabilales bacterium]
MELLVPFLLLVAGAGLGALGALVWVRGRRAGEAADLAARLASQAATAEELRRQLLEGRETLARKDGELMAATAERAALAARAEEARASLEAERALLDEAKAKLTEAFKALAAEALQQSHQGFLALAEQRFQALAQAAEGELEQKRTAIDTLVQPLRQTLEAYQKEARELEEKRLREISGVGKQLEQLAGAQAALQKETANLVNALRAPQVRGRWGEIALRKTAELAGMTKYCDFDEQASVTTEGGRLRPDMVVHLPAGRDIVVDSKVPLLAYLDAVEAQSTEEREAALLRHAQQVRTHVKRLASKEYWSQFQQAPEFAVLFIPGEAFFAAAAERDPDLLQSALANHVLIATPTTFIGLLLTAAYGWRQEQVAQNAARISDLGRQVHERLAVLIEHLARVGKSLDASVDAYNKAVGSLESRLLPAARRFADLDAGLAKPLPELPPVSTVPRLPAADPDA